ncbi:MAG: ABC transporter ATP-binding protein, partial [Acidiferrobacterales bacterium]
PEHFMPRDVLNGDEDFVQFPFRVTRVEYLGADRLLYGVLGSPFHDVKVIAELPSMVTASIEPGQPYEFFVKSVNVNRFDKTTGRRIEASRGS